jgi:ABC-2 type transport system permease protein
MTAFLNHFAFEFKTGLRNPTQLLMNYLFPLGLFVMMGLIMTQVNPLFAETMIPAMSIIAAMSSGVLGQPGTLVESREAGIFRSFKINGVPALSILTIPMVTTMFTVLVVTAIITVSGPLFGGALPSNWAGFSLVTVAMAFSFSALGALIGVVSTDSRSIVLYSQLIFLPSMILGGLMVPIDILPASVQSVSALLPATHAMEAYRGLAFGEQTVLGPWVSFLVLLTTGLLAFALAVYLFSWDSRNTARRGHPALALLALLPCLASFAWVMAAR